MARCSLFVLKVPLNTPTNCAKVDVWLVQIEEAERRQQLLVDILRKEQEHRQRLVSLSFVWSLPNWALPNTVITLFTLWKFYDLFATAIILKVLVLSILLFSICAKFNKWSCIYSLIDGWGHKGTMSRKLLFDKIAKIQRWYVPLCARTTSVLWTPARTGTVTIIDNITTIPMM